MFSVQILISTSLLVSSVHSSLLETLLETTLRTASCQARCRDVASEQLQDCLQICSQVIEDPSASICSFPRFCTGGCRAACQSERREEGRLSVVSQQECGLSWRMEDHINNVVFNVAGLDQGGMLSVISEHLLDSSLQLTAEMTSKFLEMTVLAVDGQGLIDMETVLLEEVENCPLIKPGQHSPASVFSEENLTHVCLLVVIVIIMIIFIVVKIVRSIKQEPVKKQTLEKVSDFDNIFLICQESLTEDVKYLNLS